MKSRIVCLARIIGLIVLLVLAAPRALRAEPGAGPWVGDATARARLIAGADAVGDGALSLGLEITLAPGWKTYWRSPGEGGVAPDFDWSAARNLAAPTIAWPAPHLVETAGIVQAVYDGRIVLPIAARAADPAGPVQVALLLRYGVCEKICLPREARLTFDLPAGPAAATPQAAAIAAARGAVPADFAAAGLTLRFARIAGGAEPTLAVSITSTPPMYDAALLVDGPDDVWFDPPHVAAENGTLLYRMTIGPANAPDRLRGKPITLTILNPGRNAQTTIQPEMP